MLPTVSVIVVYIYKGKIEKDIFSEGNIHLIQPIYIKASIGTHQRFKVLSAANILCCASQKTWIHYVHCLQEKIEKATFGKEFGKITFLSYTLKSLRTLFTLGTK